MNSWTVALGALRRYWREGCFCAPRVTAPALVALLALAGGPLAAQAPRLGNVELAALGVMRSDSVTEPVSARVGLDLGSHFSVEYALAYARSSEGYFEATAQLCVTVAGLTGSGTNKAGGYVAPCFDYHYEGGPAQLGLGLEMGVRAPLGGICAARMGPFTTDWLKTRQLPGPVALGILAGVSCWPQL